MSWSAFLWRNLLRNKVRSLLTGGAIALAIALVCFLATMPSGMNAILDKHDIETIAPGYGCILRGRKTVERHIKLVDDVLKSLDKSVAVSRYVGRDEER